MSSRRHKEERKKERRIERIIEATHKSPCPICEYKEEGVIVCCSHCNHKALWGK